MICHGNDMLYCPDMNLAQKLTCPCAVDILHSDLKFFLFVCSEYIQQRSRQRRPHRPAQYPIRYCAAMNGCVTVQSQVMHTSACASSRCTTCLICTNKVGCLPDDNFTEQTKKRHSGRSGRCTHFCYDYIQGNIAYMVISVVSP